MNIDWINSTDKLIVFKLSGERESLVAMGLTGREKYVQVHRIRGGKSVDVLAENGDSIESYSCGPCGMDCLGDLSKARFSIIFRAILDSYGNDLGEWNLQQLIW